MIDFIVVILRGIVKFLYVLIQSKNNESVEEKKEHVDEDVVEVDFVEPVDEEKIEDLYSTDDVEEILDKLIEYEEDDEFKEILKKLK